MTRRISTQLPIALAALSAGMLWTSQPLLAQAPEVVERVTPSVKPGLGPSEGELTPQVQIYIARGDELVGAGRYGPAFKQYEMAVKTAREQGHLPSLSSWRWANACFFDGEFVKGADVLDELAQEAATFGDIVVQARALVNAAWLYGKAGREAQMLDRIAQVEKIVQSPYLPIEEREYLVARMGGSPTLTSVP